MMRCLVTLATHRGIAFHQSRRAVVRKLRLLWCGCARARWCHLPDEGRRAIEVIERFADGRAGARAFREARRAVAEWLRGSRLFPPGTAAPEAAEAMRFAVTAGEVHARLSDRYAVAAPPGEIGFLQDLFGNPFRPVEVAPAWRTATVVGLARAIYAERAFDLMPVLCDALQDAGCTNEDVLAHCRDRTDHARGCWLLDALIGTE
ncbi:hypothetical protein R5W24_002482 [Gemmata sp. JC717]|uniref:hypothetical protein n=1 Tax=Gemmata algarum TaxID=2975278 RepID=UPI0021BB6CA7|nr:hypothetical protein [Gemmata algarum]MDY3553381.1 hypothetical protein [Gemmata algarum]